MGEGTTLANFEEWFLTGLSWSHETGLVLSVEDFNQSSTAAVVFQGISLLRVLASRVKDSKTENEIWKVEEIPRSPLLRNTIEKDGMHWLEQRFGDKYRRTKPTREPGHQRHFVLLTDYLDVELICTGYVVSQK